MRKVSIKELYSSVSFQMQSLPFEVTKKGKNIGYMVSSLDHKSDIETKLVKLSEKRERKSRPDFFNPQPKTGKGGR